MVPKMKRHPRRKTLSALGVVVLCVAACDPGWVNPVVGTGDGSGILPGAGAVAVANEDVALASPLVISALSGGGLLVYENDSCTIMKVLKATTTRFAGTGTCGHTGDGGPAIDAEIEEAGLGVGLWRNTSGDLFIDTDHGKGIRRIDGQTGVITALPVTVGDQEDIFGGSADPDGSFTYLVDDLGDHSTFTIRRVDAHGNDATLFTQTGSILPVIWRCK